MIQHARVYDGGAAEAGGVDEVVAGLAGGRGFEGVEDGGLEVVEDFSGGLDVRGGGLGGAFFELDEAVE